MSRNGGTVFRSVYRQMSSAQQTISVIDKLKKSPSTTPIQQFRKLLQTEIEEIKKAGTWKDERIITSPQKTIINVHGKTEKLLNFCANNYLGLSYNEEILTAATKALYDYGNGLSSVRFICGTQSIHKDLEQKLSDYHQKEDTILYSSCFDANAGLFEAILSPDDAVFSDELNHASIIDGIRLCKAKKFRYKHRDMDDLEKKLKSSGDARIRLIVSDGVFSMDGNIAPLPDICKLAKENNALTFLDECHATGFLGEKGRGTEDYYKMIGSVDIINSTLGKALGGASGGYTTGPKELIDILRQRSRPYLFSNSLPPVIVGIALKVLDLLTESNYLVSKVTANTERFRKSMKSAGFEISGDQHPICPVMIGDAKLANVFANEMLTRGIYVIGFSYPVVPKGKARIRVQISAAHTFEEIDRAVATFTEVGKKLNVVQ
ncbi:2-amino-3-ketobutyrate coenzyme A ligase, mitochondrial [Chrysoperla carnea]|uniref:2-amino-3-ketobutyrate coenzyme A ligase, mitochondrial n=1 Tax=Chrysoperla carnea TaxID=189513 RepID=UPI001D0890E0|nr:2-amino-3-ketobutyrate coenzyme A ligase, mitochondrial [Chrysoperla carnea]XP_044736255.1 2-amino-3-ketobutyrate coenzyme A ligase, mitochondrial [Chrysoperla carnea]